MVQYFILLYFIFFYLGGVLAQWLGWLSLDQPGVRVPGPPSLKIENPRVEIRGLQKYPGAKKIIIKNILF